MARLPGRLVSFREEFYIYKTHHFEKLERAAVEHLVWQFACDESGSEFVTARLISDTVDLLRQMVFIDGKQSPPFRIGETIGSFLVLRNGVLTFDNLYGGGEPVLLPHDEQWFALGAADYDYDPAADCPLWDEWLAWFTCGNCGVAALIEEFVAYILLQNLQLQKFLWLHGAGNNAKSVLLSLIERLLGPANVSHVPLDQLTGRFALIELDGRMANVVADCSDTGGRLAEGRLKQIVGGDQIFCDRKHRPGINAAYRGRLIFASNQRPWFVDKSEGMWRRLLVVDCKAVVNPEQRQQRYENVLAAELSGILNRAIAAGARLIERGDFAVPPAVVDATLECKLDANPTRRFLQANYAVDDAGFVKTSMLYEAYRSWCVRWGYRACTACLFGREIQATFGIERIRKTAGDFRPWGYPLRHAPENKQGIEPAAGPEACSSPEKKKKKKSANVPPAGLEVEEVLDRLESERSPLADRATKAIADAEKAEKEAVMQSKIEELRRQAEERLGPITPDIQELLDQFAATDSQ